LEDIFISAYNFYGVRTKICPKFNETCAGNDTVFNFEIAGGLLVTLNSTFTIQI